MNCHKNTLSLRKKKNVCISCNARHAEIICKKHLKVHKCHLHLYLFIRLYYLGKNKQFNFMLAKQKFL
jgi:hypothetical protein